jgi:hypothetical protein
VRDWTFLIPSTDQGDLLGDNVVACNPVYTLEGDGWWAVDYDTVFAANVGYTNHWYQKLDFPEDWPAAVVGGYHTLTLWALRFETRDDFGYDSESTANALLGFSAGIIFDPGPTWQYSVIGILPQSNIDMPLLTRNRGHSQLWVDRTSYSTRENQAGMHAKTYQLGVACGLGPDASGASQSAFCIPAGQMYCPGHYGDALGSVGAYPRGANGISTDPASLMIGATGQSYTEPPVHCQANGRWGFTFTAVDEGAWVPITVGDFVSPTSPLRDINGEYTSPPAAGPNGGIEFACAAHGSVTRTPGDFVLWELNLPEEYKQNGTQQLLFRIRWKRPSTVSYTNFFLGLADVRDEGVTPLVAHDDLGEFGDTEEIMTGGAIFKSDSSTTVDARSVAGYHEESFSSTAYTDPIAQGEEFVLGVSIWGDRLLQPNGMAQMQEPWVIVRKIATGELVGGMSYPIYPSTEMCGRTALVVGVQSTNGTTDVEVDIAYQVVDVLPEADLTPTE